MTLQELNNKLKNRVITQEEYVLRRLLFRLENSPKSEYNENLKKRINQKLKELNEWDTMFQKILSTSQALH